MLIEFSVGNFRSFKDRQTFSMVASSDKVLLDQTMTSEALGKLRLNRSAVVYGANASGKSNLMAALAFVRSFVVDSYRRRPARLRERVDDTSIQVIPFLLDPDTAKKPSEFELVFIQNDVRYQYGFTADATRIHKEWLYAFPHGQPQRWFVRTLQDDGEYEYEFRSKAFRGEKQLITEVTRPDTLYLSSGVTFASEQLLPVYNWFQNLHFLKPFHRSRVSLGNDTAQRAFRDAEFHRKVRSLLIHADVGIVDFQVDEIESQFVQPVFFPDDGGTPALKPLRYETSFVHEAAPNDRLVRLPLSEESQGTQQLYEMAYAWIEAVEQGQILVADELDASLHPLLTRRLVEMLQDPQINYSGAQLIFNTHDVTLLDQALFRRDQVWFTEKDREGATHLYPLLDFSPRKQEALDRGYMVGRYGAIPFIDRLEDWFEPHGSEKEEAA